MQNCAVTHSMACGEGGCSQRESSCPRVELLKHSPELKTIVSEDDINRIADIIGHGKTRSLLIDIVSGPVDADKLDYLLRDSYYAGVKYGIHDLEWLVGEAVAIRRGKAENLGFHESAV